MDISSIISAPHLEAILRTYGSRVHLTPNALEWDDDLQDGESVPANVVWYRGDRGTHDITHLVALAWENIDLEPETIVDIVAEHYGVADDCACDDARCMDHHEHRESALN